MQASVHQPHAVVVRLRGDERLVFLEFVVQQRDDRVVAFRHGRVQAVVFEARDVAFDIRFAGDDLTAPTSKAASSK